MSALIEAALAVGLPVFPCAADKRPCIPKAEGGNGYLDATGAAAKIERMFAHQGARLIAVPTGERSGLDVLDFDYRHGAEEFEEANKHRLPETRIHQTQSGGRHYIFRHAPGVRNWTTARIRSKSSHTGARQP